MNKIEKLINLLQDRTCDKCFRWEQCWNLGKDPAKDDAYRCEAYYDEQTFLQENETFEEETQS